MYMYGEYREECCAVPFHFFKLAISHFFPKTEFQLHPVSFIHVRVTIFFQLVTQLVEVQITNYAGNKKSMKTSKRTISSNQRKHVVDSHLALCVTMCGSSRKRSFIVLLATLKEDFKRQQRINMDKEPAVKDMDKLLCCWSKE